MKGKPAVINKLGIVEYLPHIYLYIYIVLSNFALRKILFVFQNTRNISRFLFNFYFVMFVVRSSSKDIKRKKV